jgi:hypothetical protein
MRERQVLRLDHDRLVVHADLSSIATWHCNDMVVDAEGRAYVGNFGFDLHAPRRQATSRRRRRRPWPAARRFGERRPTTSCSPTAR